jgi:hypothetical protein
MSRQRGVIYRVLRVTSARARTWAVHGGVRSADGHRLILSAFAWAPWPRRVSQPQYPRSRASRKPSGSLLSAGAKRPVAAPQDADPRRTDLSPDDLARWLDASFPGHRMLTSRIVTLAPPGSLGQ